MTDFYEYHSLDGVDGGILQGPLVKSVTAALAALSWARACAIAGSHGCVQVWMDDDGNYRGDFMRFHHHIDDGEFATKAALKDWLKTWAPKVHVRPE